MNVLTYRKRNLSILLCVRMYKTFPVSESITGNLKQNQNLINYTVGKKIRLTYCFSGGRCLRTWFLVHLAHNKAANSGCVYAKHPPTAFFLSRFLNMLKIEKKERKKIRLLNDDINDYWIIRKEKRNRTKVRINHRRDISTRESHSLFKM